MISVGLAVAWPSASLADLPPPPPGAQIVTHYGLEFGVVGSPGNVPYRDADMAGRPWHLAGSQFDGRGSVPYTFQMARTETTVTEWAGFLNAYIPHWTGEAWTRGLIGGDVSYLPDRGFFAEPIAARTPVAPSWAFSAAYCNWLHNGRGNSLESFTTDSYDLRGLDLAHPEHWTQPIQPLPGATYRLPTWDEWNKAMYFDPNRNGQGQGGWWLFPMRQDTPPISGDPGTPGAQTLAGSGWVLPPGSFQLMVGMYPDSQSAFGMLDGSGSASEWLTMVEPDFPFTGLFARTIGSAAHNGGMLFFDDQLGWNYSYRAIDTGTGLRLVFVPTPSTFALLAAILSLPRFGGRVQSMGNFPSEAALLHGRQAHSFSRSSSRGATTRDPRQVARARFPPHPLPQPG